VTGINNECFRYLALRGAHLLAVLPGRATPKTLEKLGKIGRVVGERSGHGGYGLIGITQQLLGHGQDTELEIVARRVARHKLNSVAEVRRVNAQHPGQVADFKHLGGPPGHEVGQMPVDFTQVIGVNLVLPGHDFFGDGSRSHALVTISAENLPGCSLKLFKNLLERHSELAEESRARRRTTPERPERDSSASSE